MTTSVARRPSARVSRADAVPATAHPAAVISSTGSTPSTVSAAVTAVPTAAAVAVNGTQVCQAWTAGSRVWRRLHRNAARTRTAPVISRASATANRAAAPGPGLPTTSWRSSPRLSAHTVPRHECTVTRSPGSSAPKTGPAPRNSSSTGGPSPGSTVTRRVSDLFSRRLSLATATAGQVARQSPFSGTAASAHGRAARKSWTSDSFPGSVAKSTAAASTRSTPIAPGARALLRSRRAGGGAEGEPGSGAAPEEGEVERVTGTLCGIQTDSRQS